MKNILVVFTGGTIGSRVDKDTINVDQSMSRVILNGFSKAYPDEPVNFRSVQPMNVLSENFTPKHWKVISDCIEEHRNAGLDGVIVTHGSDTIPYTSAYIAYVFSKSDIPVVLTCSNHVLTHPKSNGQENFNNSVLLISRNTVKGVFSLFQNSGGRNVVYLATRMEEANPYDDQFTTCGGIEFGQVSNGKLILVSHPTNPAYTDIMSSGSKKITSENQVSFENEIFALKAYPGLNYTNFCLNEKTKAVLCRLYHSSSNCIGTDEYSVTEFIERCKKQGVDVYLMSFKNTDGEHYLTTKTIVEAGGLPLVNISFEAAYVKLNIAYNQTHTDPAIFMKKKIYYEVL